MAALSEYNKKLSLEDQNAKDIYEKTTTDEDIIAAQLKATASALTKPTDYSDFIREMSSAALNSQLDALDAAQKNANSQLDYRKDQIDPLYYDARNTLAATSSASGKNFNEYAAARGLSSGAAAQMEISRAGALQSGLTGLNRDQTKAYNDIEAERSQIASDYAYKIAAAKADGQYKLAEALYNEAVRVDNAMLSYGQAQANLNLKYNELDYTRSQDALDRNYQQQLFEYQREQDEILNRLKEAGITGYYNGEKTFEAIQSDIKNAQAAAKTSSSSSSSSKSSGSGTASSKESNTTSDSTSIAEITKAENRAKNGWFDENTVAILLRKYGYDEFMRLYGSSYNRYIGAIANGQSPGPSI